MNFAGWNPKADRCEKEGHILFYAPIPDDFIYSPANWLGKTPNAGLAVLMNDGRTIRQVQPFSRCKKGSYATAGFTFPDVDIYGDGIPGAHGGSALSAIGGCIRVGELVPGGKINHVLKINLWGKTDLSKNNGGF
ncbi:MAG: hypothetical protein HC906_06360 [Bacteroidales bacterium]|nr:hypothetical protein [Bacteroidales bacterium]